MPHLSSTQPCGHAANLLSRRAELTPDRVAVIDETGAAASEVTFAELNARANRAAHLLTHELGVQPGDRVAVLAHNTLAYLDLLYAVGKIGAVLCPLNWRLTGAELTYIVGHAAPKVLFVGPECVELAAEVLEVAEVERVIAVDDAVLGDAPSYDAMVRCWFADEPPPPSEPLHADTPYAILYTSGTTGRPKGAIIPHRQVLWNCMNVAASWGLDEDDRTPIFLPMFHAGGLLALTTPLLYLGASITLHRGFDPDDTLRAIAQHRCTVILGVPTIFQMWLDCPSFEATDLSHVKFFITGGAPCPRPVMERFKRDKPGAVFRQGYGLTEVGPNCFSMTNAQAEQKVGSIGRPIFHSEVRVVDSDGAEVAPGEAGELLLSGPHVCAGYFNDSAATQRAIVDGWFHTGDVVRRDDDGFFYVAGRKKEMIITGGENVYAAEVEAVFDDHPAVIKSALIGQPDAQWGELGVIVAELRDEVSAEDLLRFGRTRLARYKLPRRVEFTREMPYSAYGKVLKGELRQRYATPTDNPPTREAVR